MASANLIIILHRKQEEIKLCLRWESDSPVPLQQRPDIDNWGTGLQALESALELENTLNKLLQDLKTLASENHETDVSSSLVLKAGSSSTSGL